MSLIRDRSGEVENEPDTRLQGLNGVNTNTRPGLCCRLRLSPFKLSYFQPIPAIGHTPLGSQSRASHICKVPPPARSESPPPGTGEFRANTTSKRIHQTVLTASRTGVTSTVEPSVPVIADGVIDGTMASVLTSPPGEIKAPMLDSRSAQAMPPLAEPPSPGTVKQEPDRERGRPRSGSYDKDVDGLELDDGDDGQSSNSEGPARKRRRSRKGLDKKFECPEKGCGKSYSRAEHLYVTCK